ncbi:NFACT family protein [Synergistaceae bacterium OttesenSCG-928-I11]|nr:NFACT family protein [Synergistaceae bacterium OttesenSCG-928-I11]
MPLGPELVALQSSEITVCFAAHRVRKVEACDVWLALSFSRDRALFFSWDAEWYGLCSATPGEVRELALVASHRPPILDALKSHLVGAEIVCAHAPSRDRAMRIEFRRPVGAGVHQTRTLVLEASGRYSNAVLLDEDGCVVEAAKHIHPDVNRYRSILPGSAYVAPPAIEGVSLDAFDPSSPGTASQLDRLLGLGKPLLNALKKGDAQSLDGITFFRTNEGEVVYQALGHYVTAYPTLLRGADALGVRSPLEAARSVVVVPLIRRHLDRLRKKISSDLARAASLNAKKIEECEGLVRDEDAAERLMETGRLILANAWAIPPRAAEAELTEWTEAGESRRLVRLDPALDAAGNAERYFTKYKKKRAAADRAKKILPKLLLEREEIAEQAALLDCHDDVATLIAMASEMERAQKKERPKRKKNAESLPPHRRLELDELGASIFWGLSAKGNHYVTFRLARPDDLWLHAKDIPGAHVILRFGHMSDEAAYDRAVEIAAICAARYSKAGKGGPVRVDFTERKYVRPIPGGGGAHVTYREFSTVVADPALWPEVSEPVCEAE